MRECQPLLPGQPRVAASPWACMSRERSVAEEEGGEMRGAGGWKGEGGGGERLCCASAWEEEGEEGRVYVADDAGRRGGRKGEGGEEGEEERVYVAEKAENT